MSKAKVTFLSAPDTSAIDIEDEGSLIVSNPTAMNFTGPGVTVTENPTGTAEVDIPGLQYWTESEDAAVQQSTIFTPNNAATNVNAVLLPKGTGANTAQTPDGTTTGGNARGEYATDWQKVRSAADQVASGDESVILGGVSNKASGERSIILGGASNTASGQYAIAGGWNHNATGLRSLAMGDFQCTASGIGSTAISNQTTVSGQSAAAVGGDSMTISGRNSFQAAGANNNLSGQYAFNYGRFNVIAGNYSAGGGWKARTHLLAQKSHSAGQFSVAGDAQEFTVLARRQAELTTGATTVLTLDGTGTTNPIIVRTGAGGSAHTVWNVVASWAATVTNISGTATGVNVGDVITQCNLFGFKEYSETPSIIGSVSNVGTHNDASMATASMTFGAAGTNELTLTFTAPTFAGGGTLTMRVLCKLMITAIEF